MTARTDAPIAIAPARTPADMAAAASLFRDYAASLPVDLSYQNFDQELASLPGKYAPPAGELLLARSAAGQAAGCVALRPTGLSGICEMKRLYVASSVRGTGLGGRLVAAIVAAATDAGYREIRLDTLPSMRQAQQMYASLGFERIEPYYASPVAGTIYMRLGLAQ